MTEISPTSIGGLIRIVRHQRGLSQDQLAEAVGTEASQINAIESGETADADLVNRSAEALQHRLFEKPGAAMHLRVKGPTKLHGSIHVRSSKNAAVALLCASLLNHGRTVLRGIARIEEVNRILEVLESIGMKVEWAEDKSTLTLERPAVLDLESMNVEAARRTRSIIMFLGPLVHMMDLFQLPYAGGCNLGTRTVTPHMQALHNFGLDVTATEGWYKARVHQVGADQHNITLTERGDTVTENVLMAAALNPGLTVIRNASPNYMVQDLCFFLQQLGVQIDGIGTTTLRVRGVERIDKDVEVSPSEDPIEAMSLITAAIVTGSELTIERCPIEFLEIELAILEEMGQDFSISPEYPADNGHTRLVDITVRPSHLHAAADKIHPMPFPGLNIDNLPFFAVIAAVADGRTLIHDWVYENRAIHLLDLGKLGATTQLLDPHRLNVQGPTRWRPQELVSPPALRPAVCLLLATLAASGTSVLRDVYVINRGYEDLPNRLNALGAEIEVFYD
ncbi:helix-turn-helix domain-containing protein [Nigerium massiliense]|uniref:helix-turn-helix domain-containing protein n=1 Tax=Nigerium massiliense TaxID=1522317 RepID=UPI0009E4E205|nr:UDP-N-acetylglucosamine 1-carboxyvinyltransferase [Nigerium massiliense]